MNLTDRWRTLPVKLQIMLRKWFLSRTHSGLVDWRFDVRYGHAELVPRLAQTSTRMESVRRWRDQPDVWVAENVLHQ